MIQNPAPKIIQQRNESMIFGAWINYKKLYTCMFRMWGTVIHAEFAPNPRL